MRRRLAAVLVAAAAVAAVSVAARAHAIEPTRASSGSSRLTPSEVPSTALSGRVREQLDRDGETAHPQLVAVLGGLALLAATAWWVALRRQASTRRSTSRATARPRAPPIALSVSSS